MDLAARDGGERAPGARSALALIGLLWLARGVLVLALGDVFFWGEELSRGTAAKAMVDGLAVPHFGLAYNDFEGGAFLASHLTVPAFVLVGENLLAHKLVALTIASAILLAGWWLCRASLGPRAALAFGLLFVCAPASFMKLSLLNLGSHFGALLFLALILHFALRAWRDATPCRACWLRLGVASGLGLFFSYQNGVAVAFAGLALLALAPRRVFSRWGAWGLLGLLIGLLPLAAMYAALGPGVFEIHAATAAADAAESSGWHGVVELARSIFAGRNVLGAAALVVAPTLAIVAVIAAVRGRLERDARAGVLFVAAYLAVFAAVYVASPFGVGEVRHAFEFNRLSPAWLAVTVLAAAAIGSGWQSPRAAMRSTAVVALAMLVAIGVADEIAIARAGPETSWASRWQRLVQTKGYSFTNFIRHFEARRSGDPRTEIPVLLGFRESSTALLRSSIASALFVDRKLGTAEAIALVKELDPAHWLEYLPGMGRLLWLEHGRELAERIRGAQSFPEPERSALLEAVGRSGQGPQVTELALRAEIAAGGELMPDPYYRGIGYRLYEFGGASEVEHYHQRNATPWCLDHEAAEEFIREQDPRCVAPLLAGFRRAVAERTSAR